MRDACPWESVCGYVCECVCVCVCVIRGRGRYRYRGRITRARQIQTRPDTNRVYLLLRPLATASSSRMSTLSGRVRSFRFFDFDSDSDPDFDDCHDPVACGAAGTPLPDASRRPDCYLLWHAARQGIGVKLRDLNAQHPTPNAQLPREKWLLAVGCWALFSWL